MLHINRILSLVLVSFLLLTCIGCHRDNTDTDVDRQPQIPTGVWALSEPMTLPSAFSAGSNRGFTRDADGNIYFTASPTRYAIEYQLMRYAPDGTMTALPYPDGGFNAQPPYMTAHPLCFTVLPDGGFATVFDIGQSEMLVITDDNNRITAQTEIPYFGTINTVEHIIYAPAQDTVYVGSGDGFAAYTREGALLWTHNPSYPIIGLGTTKDGTGYVCAYDLLTDISVISVRVLDNTAKRPGEAYLLPEAVNLLNADLIDHPAYDVCWNAGDVIWGCDFLPAGTDAKTVMPVEIINLLNSDISADTIEDLIFLNADEALLYSFDIKDPITESTPYYAHLSRVPKEELTPVFEITVAACGPGTLAEYALAFNASQDNYRVVFRSYDTYGLDDAEKPRAAFETDLITGNIPDIVLGNGFFKLDDYVHLGIFADMYTYLDADPDFGRDNLHACVLEPFETEDGTLPYLVNTFYISTIEATAASAEKIPENWTFADAAALAVEMENDGMLFYVTGDSGMALLKKLLPPTVTGLFEDGKTNREALSSLLSFCRDYETSDTLSSGDRTQMLSDGTILSTMQTHLQNPYHYLDSRYGVGHGTAPVYVGFPSAAGNGSAVSMREGFAITTTAAEHEIASQGAWEFVRYVLENQTYEDGGTRVAYFGAAKDSLERLLDSAENVYCLHYDADRASLAYYQRPHMHNENDKTPTVISFDGDDRAAIRALIDGITVRADAYPAVCDIIYEDASAYFAGVKTLAQTVEIIASRAELYFAERQ